ncbi:MAG: hypothetical protein ACRC1D_08040, partial [Culicoidibacterales bacterium]
MCPAGTKDFRTQRAFSQHVHHSVPCFTFLCNPTYSKLAKQFDQSLLTHNCTSTKAPSATLQRDFQNTTFLTNPTNQIDTTVFEDSNLDCFDDTSSTVEPTPTTEQPFLYTTDQKWTVKLLKILDSIDAPDDVFGQIILWARNAVAEKYSFHPPGGLSRTTNVKLLFESMQNANKLLPIVKQVGHSSADNHVIVFDFVPQLLNLLQNKSIMKQENLLIDMDNPLKKFQSPDGKLSDALSGTVYQAAYDRLIDKPDKQLCVPIIQWIDRTNVTGNDRFTLKPYMFTPAIFTETFRRTISAWGYHGFLPKPNLSSAENRMQETGNNLRQYHQQLSVVLDSFQNSATQLKDIILPLGR